MTKNVKVQIINSPDSIEWYSNKIGQEFYVKHYNEIYYYVTTAVPIGGYKIRKEDCKIITEKKIL